MAGVLIGSGVSSRARWRWRAAAPPPRAAAGTPRSRRTTCSKRSRSGWPRVRRAAARRAPGAGSGRGRDREPRPAFGIPRRGRVRRDAGQHRGQLHRDRHRGDRGQRAGHGRRADRRLARRARRACVRATCCCRSTARPVSAARLNEAIERLRGFPGSRVRLAIEPRGRAAAAGLRPGALRGPRADRARGAAARRLRLRPHHPVQRLDAGRPRRGAATLVGTGRYARLRGPGARPARQPRRRARVGRQRRRRIPRGRDHRAGRRPHARVSIRDRRHGRRRCCAAPPWSC